jgi:hypothetical protein
MTQRGGTVTKTVDCQRGGKVIASYRLSYGITLGPSTPPDLINGADGAKESLINDGFVKPPFDFTGWDFIVRNGR